MDDIVALRLDKSNDCDRRVKELIDAPKVNFADIFKLIKEQRAAGAISNERFFEIYNYVYSCYSINIPTETGCFLDTKATHIPLHLGCGIGDFCDTPPTFDYGQLRQTWVFNPEVLDYLSFEDFVDIRQILQKTLPNGFAMIHKHNMGILQDDEWDYYVAFWEMYVHILETEIKNRLKEKYEANLLETIEKFGCRQLTQIKDCGIEFVINAIGNVPVIGTATGIISSIGSVKKGIIAISNLPKEKQLNDQRETLKKYIGNDYHVVTKFKS